MVPVEASRKSASRVIDLKIILTYPNISKIYLWITLFFVNSSINGTRIQSFLKSFDPISVKKEKDD